MKFTITRNDLPDNWDDLQKIGLAKVGDSKRVTDRITITVGDGGVWDESVPRNLKVIFRKQIFPRITSLDEKKRASYELILHFRNSSLCQADIQCRKT